MQQIKQELIDSLYTNLENLEICYSIINHIPCDAISECGFNLPTIIALTNSVALIEYVMNNLNISFDCCDDYGYTALHLAAKFNCFESCQYIVTNKLVEINLATTSGYTPLLLAVSSADIHLIKFLVNNGANALATSRSGKGILYYAWQNQHAGVAEYLATLILRETENDKH